jgi:hypothetical protein
MASMSILDDAIREHLELKRAHGADEAELKKLEDEAFGPPARPEEPDPFAEAPTPFAEAPTEFMSTPEAAEATETAGDEPAARRIDIADLQEPPEPKAAEPVAEAPAADVEVTPAAEPPQIDAAPVAPAEDPAQAAPPAEEEPLAMEHDIVPEPSGPAEPEAQPEAGIEQTAEASHSTEERHAIAEQPTELFDIESEMGTEDAPPTEAPSPSDEQLVDAEAAEPKLAPVEPPTEIYASRAPAADELDEEEDDEFWSDQRLSDELDQALEAPITDEHEAPAPVAEAPAAPVEPTAPLLDEKEDEGERHEELRPESGHEDVLEDTPDFLEDAPEDDELWFEQRPPKDFDFDD